MTVELDDFMRELSALANTAAQLICETSGKEFELRRVLGEARVSLVSIENSIYVYSAKLANGG